MMEMEMVYRATRNLVLSVAVLLFYQKILAGKAIKPICWISIPLCFAIYMFFMDTVEPIRIIGSILILGFSLRCCQRNVNLAALVLAFLFGYFLWFTSALVATPIGMLIFGDFDEMAFLVYPPVEIVIYLVAYKLIKLKNGMPYINTPEVRNIIFAATGTVLLLIGTQHTIVTRIDEQDAFLFISSLIAIVFSVLIVAALITYLAKKHKDQLNADKAQRELEVQTRNLVELQHKYRTVVPAVGVLSGELLDELGKTADLVLMKERITALNQMTAEISEEFAVDELGLIANSFQLPESWQPLRLEIVRVLQECHQKDIDVFAQNRTKQWEKISFSKTKFIRLVGNLLSNALKELDKTATDDKQLLVKFFDDDTGAFTLEVFDTAHAFPVEILARLGERGNSTNGTGNGYAEIFDFLAESRASLLITEWVAGDCDAKTVAVLFDDKARLVIRTGHRYEELTAALGETKFAVEYLG